MQGHVGQTGTGDGDNALVAVGGGALIDGEGEIALAQQGARRGVRAFGQHRRQTLGIGLGVAAQRATIGAIGQQHADRAVALHLQTECAAKFQRR